MERKHFCGLEFDWNYDAGYVDIKIPNYVFDELYSFQHTPTSQPQHSPHAHIPIGCGDKHHYAKGPDLPKHLNKKEMKHVQLVVGTFLYYAQAVESTMLPANN